MLSPCRWMLWQLSLDSTLCRRCSLVCQTSVNSLCLENQFKLFSCLCAFGFVLLAFCSHCWQSPAVAEAPTLSAADLSGTGYKIWAKELGTAMHGILWLRSSYVRALHVPYACQHLLFCTQKKRFSFFFLLKSSWDANVLLRLPWVQLVSSFLGNRKEGHGSRLAGSWSLPAEDLFRM